MAFRWLLTSKDSHSLLSYALAHREFVDLALSYLYRYCTSHSRLASATEC